MCVCVCVHACAHVPICVPFAVWVLGQCCLEGFVWLRAFVWSQKLFHCLGSVCIKSKEAPILEHSITFLSDFPFPSIIALIASSAPSSWPMPWRIVLKLFEAECKAKGYATKQRMNKDRPPCVHIWIKFRLWEGKVNGRKKTDITLKMYIINFLEVFLSLVFWIFCILPTPYSLGLEKASIMIFFCSEV